MYQLNSGSVRTTMSTYVQFKTVTVACCPLGAMGPLRGTLSTPIVPPRPPGWLDLARRTPNSASFAG